jgi:hypothetical protein
MKNEEVIFGFKINLRFLKQLYLFVMQKATGVILPWMTGKDLSMRGGKKMRRSWQNASEKEK